MTKKIARELRADRRIEVREELGHCSVSDYLDLQVKKLNKPLRDAGNLQGVVSKPTLWELRSEFLNSKDYDPDDIEDLSKMKDAQEQDVKDKVLGAVVTIQRVAKNPFHVIQATDNQIKILLKMIEDGHPIILYVDATGGLVEFPEPLKELKKNLLLRCSSSSSP